EAERAPRGGEARGIALAPCTVAEIRADEDVARAMAAREPLGEVARAKAREAPVEALDDRAVDAARRDERKLLGKAREARGCLGRREELARQRLEGEDRGRERAAARRFGEPLEHRGVPAMHAV